MNLQCPKCFATLDIDNLFLRQATQCPRCFSEFKPEKVAPAKVSAAIPPSLPSEYVEEIRERAERTKRMEGRATPTVQVQPFDSIFVVFEIKQDSHDRWQGELEGEVSPEGLRLFPSGESELLLPPGSLVDYLGQKAFEIMLGSRRLTLAVKMPGLDEKAMADDIATFLHGDLDHLDGDDYVIPTKRFPYRAFIPLLIPVVALVAYLLFLSSRVNYFVWNVPWLLVGGGLAAGCFPLLRSESLEDSSKAKLVFGVTGAVSFLALMLSLLSHVSLAVS